MLALRLPPEIEQRLEALAAKTGHSKSEFAREAILTHLDEIEDAYLALERLHAKEPRVTLEQIKKDLAANSDE
jgi:RHH-type rel operon transcriptional repressor/antitoxin RelB